MTGEHERHRRPLGFLNLPQTPKPIHEMNDDELTEF